MESILKTLSTISFTGLMAYGLGVNTCLYLFSIGLHNILSRFSQANWQANQQAILQSDIILSMFTVLCNTLVFVLGVCLWKYGFIALARVQTWFPIASEVFFMLLLMDFLMYLFHRFIHFSKFIRGIHQRHHRHESTNMFSLFVLHPLESLGFGLMILGVLCLFSFSAISIAWYLFINLLWGTLGHLNHSILPPFCLNLAKKSCIGTSAFHYLHHQHPDFNFGFYTSIWDILFKTLDPSMSSKTKKNKVSLL